MSSEIILLCCLCLLVLTLGFVKKIALWLQSVMSRSIVLVFLLVVLIITSQFEWKQQLVNETEASPNVSQKQNPLLNREVVKEKIILSQEKNIQRLTALVHRLQQQLLQCRDSNNTVNFTENSLKTNVNEIER